LKLINAMKVLFMFGGLPHYYNSVLNKLNKINGLEIVVVVPGIKSSTLGAGVFERKEGIEFRLIRAEEYKAWYGKPMLKGFAKILKRENPDIVVTIWPYVLGVIFDPLLFFQIKLKNIKLIFKEIPFGIPKFNDSLRFYFNDNVYSEESHEEIKYSKNLANYVKIISLSLLRLIYYNLCNAHVNYIEEAYDILGSYGVKKEKIFITYNSPDTDALLKAKEEADKQAYILPANRFRITHIGRLVSWKRVDLLLNAAFAMKYRFPAIEVLIIGDGPKRNELEALADSLGISENVKFIGAVYDPVLLGRYYKVSSIYVLAGMGGLSINEAMIYGKPVVCSVADGTEKKLVRDNFNGKYFEKGNLEDLVEKLDFLLSNPKIIEDMGKNSEKIIREEINIHTVIKGYIRAFNYVTKNKFQLNY